MVQPQQQISAGGQGKQDVPKGQVAAFSSGSADLNSVFLNGLPKDTTDEKLRKVLGDLGVTAGQVTIQQQENEWRAFLSFADYASSKWSEPASPPVLCSVQRGCHH